MQFEQQKRKSLWDTPFDTEVRLAGRLGWLGRKCSVGPYSTEFSFADWIRIPFCSYTPVLDLEVRGEDLPWMAQARADQTPSWPPKPSSLPRPQLLRVLSPLKSHTDFVFVSQVKCITSSGKALKTLLSSHCPWILLYCIPLRLASAQNLACPPSRWTDRQGASGPRLLSGRQAGPSHRCLGSVTLLFRGLVAEPSYLQLPNTLMIS